MLTNGLLACLRVSGRWIRDDLRGELLMSTETSQVAVAEVDRLIREYHGLGVKDVLDAIGYLRDSNTSVIAGGSLAFGLGNERSDLDVVVTGVGAVEGSRVPVEHFVGTLRIDVWKRSQEQVEKVFGDAERALASSDAFYDKFGTVDEEADLKLLHRIAFGIQLDGAPMRLRLSRDKGDLARDLVVREYVERMRESAFLAQIADMSETAVASMMSARRAVEDVLHMVIAARGLPFTGDKWLHERLLRDANDLCAVYEKFVVLPDREGSCRKFVRTAVELCSELSGLNLAVAVLSNDAMWVPDELQVVELSGDGYIVSKEHGSLWKVDQDEVRDWKALREMCAESSSEGVACGELNEAMMTFCYRLYEQGLAMLRWTHGVPLANVTHQRTVVK
jgi:hypothetical protein